MVTRCNSQEGTSLAFVQLSKINYRWGICIQRKDFPICNQTTSVFCISLQAAEACTWLNNSPNPSLTAMPGRWLYIRVILYVVITETVTKSVPTMTLAAPKNVFYTQTLQNSRCFNYVMRISHYTIQQNVFCGKSNGHILILGGTFCSTPFKHQQTPTLMRFVLYCSLYLLSQCVRESGSSMLTYRLLVR